MFNTYIDDEDFDRISGLRVLNKNNYPQVVINGIWTNLTEVVMGKPPYNCIWDHKNNDHFDCQKSNLRPATKQQNQANRRKSHNNTSGYKNVRFDAKCIHRPYRAKLFRNGKTYQSFHATIESAAIAADLLALKLDGEFAFLNFPRKNYVQDSLGNWAMDSKSKVGDI